jgi:hypothetical protein
MKRDSLVGLADCKAVMDAAVDHPGLQYELPTIGAAINFRQRCYRFRKLMLEIEAERIGSELGASTKYDVLVIRHINLPEGINANTGKPFTASRWLQFDHKTVFGKLHFPDGTESEIEAPPPPAVEFD